MSDENKNKNNARQAKHYAAKKEEINAKRREKYRACVEKCLAEANEGYDEPFVPDKPLFTVNNKKMIDLSKHKTLSYEEIVKYLDDLELKEGTANKYKDDIKRFIRIAKCDDVIKCFKRHAVIISDVKKSKKDDGTSYSNNTRKGLFQMILFIIDRFNLKINKKPYAREFEIAKMKSIEDNTDKSEKEPIMKFSKYIEKVKTEFGEKSKMYLLAKLYDELPLRDDFQLYMVDKVKEIEDDNKGYIVMYPSKPVKIIINAYKTQDLYGVIDKNLSTELSKLIRAYVKENQLKKGDYLFGKEKQSNYISKNSEKLGLFKMGTNEFRHMKISEELAKIPSIEERKDLADKMRHSPITQLKYVRKVFKE